MKGELRFVGLCIACSIPTFNGPTNEHGLEVEAKMIDDGECGHASLRYIAIDNPVPLCDKCSRDDPSYDDAIAKAHGIWRTIRDS